MKKNDLDVPAWLNLSLLDDASTTPSFRRQPPLSLPPVQTAPAIRSAVQRAALTASSIKAPAALTAKRVSPTTKIFRDRPTLRELMSEYNRRSAFQSGRLLKGGISEYGGDRASVVGSEHFAFDRVEAIQLPSIPGKILRPS